MEYSNKTIDQLMQRFKPAIGYDYDRYKNHVYRVFLNCLMIDRNKTNEEKYALTAVFHDIGIWTNHTFDYLTPSIEQAKIYLNESGKQEWVNEISLMIYWHHKVSSYKGEYENTVETFRKADWIDVSLGLLTFSSDRKKINQYKQNLPNTGFHLFLIKQTIKNFFRHPLNPVPVFKK